MNQKFCPHCELFTNLLLQAKKTAAEEPEQKAKEVHEAWWKEQQALKEAEKERQHMSEIFDQLDTSQDKL